MSQDKKCIEQRLDKIKTELVKYTEAMGKSDSDTGLLKASINQLFDGNGSDIASINQLIIDSIKSRSEKKSKIDEDKERLQAKDVSAREEVVNKFSKLVQDEIPENDKKEPFLASKLEALANYAKSYLKELDESRTDKTRWLDKVNNLSNRVAESMGSIPENKELVVEDPVSNTFPLSDPDKGNITSSDKRVWTSFLAKRVS